MKTVSQCLLSDFDPQPPIGAQESGPAVIDYRVVPARIEAYEAPAVVVVGNLNDLLEQAGCSEDDA